MCNKMSIITMEVEAQMKRNRRSEVGKKKSWARMSTKNHEHLTKMTDLTKYDFAASLTKNMQLSYNNYQGSLIYINGY